MTCSAIADKVGDFADVDYVVVTAGSFDILHRGRRRGRRRRCLALIGRSALHPRRALHRDLHLPPPGQADLRLGSALTRSPSRRPTSRTLARRHLWMHFTDLAGFQRRRAPDHRPGRGVLRLGPARPPLPRRAVRPVRRAGRPRPERAGRGGGPSGRAARRTSRSGASATNRPSSSPPGWPTWRPATSTASSSRRVDRRRWSRRGSWPGSTSAAIGQPQRHKVISRTMAYHGTTLGALSITGVPAIRAPFEPLVPGAVKVQNTNRYRCATAAAATRARCAAPTTIEQRILMEGPDTVAAVILEPLQNTGGAIPPPEGYWARVREICDRYGVLLVSDEVICAFGRLGHWFGSRALRLPARHHHLRQGGHERLLAARRDARQRPRGRAVPRAGAAVPARTHLRRPSRLVRRGAGEPRPPGGRGPARQRARQRGRAGVSARALRDLPIVGDVRGAGYFWAIELVRDQGPREPRSTPTSATGCCAASCRPGCSRPASSAGPTTGPSP